MQVDDLKKNKEQMKRMYKVFFGIEELENGNEVLIEYDEVKNSLKERKKKRWMNQMLKMRRSRESQILKKRRMKKCQMLNNKSQKERGLSIQKLKIIRLIWSHRFLKSLYLLRITKTQCFLSNTSRTSTTRHSLLPSVTFSQCQTSLLSST
jgi:hypothetical protein